MIYGINPGDIGKFLTLNQTYGNGTTEIGTGEVLVGSELAQEFNLKVGTRIRIGSFSSSSRPELRIAGVLNARGTVADGVSTDNAVVVNSNWYTDQYGGKNEWTQVNVMIMSCYWFGWSLLLEMFYQVFDKGTMEDGEGREIDFKNTIIILTSNAATDEIMKLTADEETSPTPEGLVKAIKGELNKIFKPAFLGRLVIIPYYPIRDEALKMIILLKLARIQRRIEENHKIRLT